MSDLIQIRLNSAAAEAKWGKNVVLTPDTAGYQLHVNTADLRAVQKAGRQLDALGIQQIQLAGEGWTVDSQWALYQGFCTAKKLGAIGWTGTAADQLQLQQLHSTFSWAKAIINQTPEDLSPVALAEHAAAFVQTVAPAGTVSTEIISGSALLEQGWVGIHAVGRGSERDPAMLVLDYNPAGKADAPVFAALVGKGITFDSGGYSIKASEGMVTMKCDMGGAATVTAALALAILQGLNKRVQLILCCAENLISGRAFKLGDILTYKNGVTVEIVNTDAEGRLVLADGLQKAAEAEPQLIIDAATLTGAAMNALGTEYNAVFALDKALAQRVLGYAEQVQEGAWQLPLEKWHQSQCPSAYADTANSRPVKGGGTGGASNAAGFLSRFVPHDGKGWVHLDLAAAFHNSANSFWAAGATGMGIRLVAHTLINE
ncbi:aminopeptidase PepB [Rheinheimera mesophila]|uniref:Aminopeptidase PepB n=1 Tax=Rheinheimera mesophila TaxID=1547515 RepID=A0A3P3QQY5_9GAMM|nr:aminopeptidase PepB [Rheinheimera mesophila]KKL03371.1 aminopeptidase B [Rheinheimera mesophila]RRJ23676.1 aminopeptidase PepB [Rheinheimera mesophila]